MHEKMSHIEKEDDKQPRTCSDGTVQGLPEPPRRERWKDALEPSFDGIKDRSCRLLKTNEVSPTQIQHLQPETHGHVSTHCQADRIEASCATERRALGKALVTWRSNVACDVASKMQWTDGQLTDCVCVSWLLIVAGRNCEYQKRTIRVFCKVLKLAVLPMREVVLLQAQLVVVVKQSTNVFIKREQDQGRNERTGGDLVPERLPEVEEKEVKAIIHYRNENNDLHQTYHDSKEQHWSGKPQKNDQGTQSEEWHGSERDGRDDDDTKQPEVPADTIKDLISKRALALKNH
mmetsp:Transcript_44089/g.116619  ORF Transcript_44089/g.116619 Transcript_44089/m.116619 type:complete len:290 (-) Transcript_44089:1169-2038(-)